MDCRAAVAYQGKYVCGMYRRGFIKGKGNTNGKKGQNDGAKEAKVPTFEIADAR